MDAMQPDPQPLPPPSISELRAQVNRLEESLRAKNHVLSGRIIHVCHHLPVEIVRVVPAEHLETGILSPPMTPEFKPEDADAKVESHDARWRIHSRAGHTAMVSGMRSLSETHKQVVVAWTGDVMLESMTAPSPRPQQQNTFSALGMNRSPSTQGVGVAPAPSALMPSITPVPEPSAKKVFNGEFNEEEKKQVEKELDRFSVVEGEVEGSLVMKYVPVFAPPEVSRGHYDHFCKKSESGSWPLPVSTPCRLLIVPALWPLFHYLLWLDTTATLPAPDPSWVNYTKMNQLFSEKVAEIYQPGDLIIVHDYHLLLAPKMIREALNPHQHQHGAQNGNGWGALQPSPAGHTEKRKGMDWEGEVTPSQARSPEQEESRLQKLGGFLGNAASNLGQQLGLNGNQVNEIMIGMFMHTPWPSSEIFRCLPSEYSS